MASGGNGTGACDFRASTLRVSDVTGRIVETISTSELWAGHHEWHCGEGLEAGVYFIGLRMNGGQWMQKMVKLD